jgi:D-alanyl-lipoteichoic acid acyltransferase DltB (MBOAT superfamily)
MSFESASFAAFLIVVVTGFWALARWRSGQKLWLLGCSLFFYSQFSWNFVGWLALSTAVNFLLGRLLGPGRPFSLVWLRVGLLFNLGLLGVFKYYDFFRESLDDVLGWVGMTSHLPVLAAVLPIGISFYSFQAVAYLVDVHRGRDEACRSPLDFALFMALFLKLLMGPIVRARELLPQLAAPAPAALTHATAATGLILSGVFKRMILANVLSSHGVAEVFAQPEPWSAATLWVVMVAYSVQLYCDFSGYTDLMRGSALWMGLRLPENFHHPYVATNVGDFWRRWHITFSNWLRDYIYFPLGGSHRSRLRTYLNLFLTFFVCGLWHGATWGFILWGSIHGVALALHKAVLDIQRDWGVAPDQVTPSALRELVGWLWTFGIICFSRIFFVSPTLSSAWVYLRRMFSPAWEGAGFDTALLVAIAVGMALQFAGPGLRRFFHGFSDGLPPALRWAFWVLCFLVLLLVRPGGVSPNAYMAF